MATFDQAAEVVFQLQSHYGKNPWWLGASVEYEEDHKLGFFATVRIAKGYTPEIPKKIGGVFVIKRVNSPVYARC